MFTVEQLIARLLAYKCLRVLVARNHLCVLTPGYDLLHLHYTFLWASFIAVKWAPVSQITHRFLALLMTLVLLVLRVVWMANPCANMATNQTELARLFAASLRGLFEIISTRRFDLSVLMILTVQSQGIPNLVPLPQCVEDVAPELDFAQHFTVANTVEPFLGTRQGYTDAIGNVQKANLALQVAANQRQQDNVILFSLVLVNDVHFDPCELFCRHEVAQAVQLSGVSCEDSNLFWFVVLKNKIAAKSDYKISLMLVLMAFPILDLLFFVVVLHKEQIGTQAL